MNVNPKHEFLIGIGHPRCGTKYFAGLLSSSGIKVGHERVSTNGIVSWMLVSERSNFPWGESLHNFRSYQDITLVARSPLSAMLSVMRENELRRSFGWRSSVIYEKTGVDILCESVVPQTQIGFAVASLTLWFELCMASNPNYRFRVDVPEDLEELSARLGREFPDPSSVNRNSRSEQYGNDTFSPEMLSDIPRSWSSRFAEMAFNLGYEQDANTIIKFCEK